MFQLFESMFTATRLLPMLGAAALLLSCTDTSSTSHAKDSSKDSDATPTTAPAPAHALDFEVKSIDDELTNLASHKGNVVLIVNVASRCGYTKQYKDLQAIHEKYSERGLRVLGFPCNQFGKQEPGSNEQIKEFCSTKFSVTFDMFGKVDVNGEAADPLFKYLTSEDRGTQITGKVKWNFEKFLIDRDGKLIKRFRSRDNPTGSQIKAAIEAALGPA